MFMTEQTEHSEQTVLVKCKKLSPLRPSHVPNAGEVDSVDTTQAETMKMGLVEDRSRVFAEFCSTEVQWRSCEQNI